MSDDWKPGDLAVCVDASTHPLCPRQCPLVEGRVYSVAFVDLAPDMDGDIGLEIEGLAGFAGYANGIVWEGSFRADRFRKVKPDTQEACEEEFITLLNRTKRRVGA